MTPTPKPTLAPQQRAGAAIVAGPWPDYTAFRHLPEADRWRAYECAKRHRADLVAQGFEMAESYDQFVRRVTAELEI
ncbi:hypothetical protein IRZ81_11985 [Pseudomonas putida]|uniref:hypothetical protein n=1 Tax=Pseudomonas putida TaxID=303 RepID=UPI0018A8DE9D|nr:hypothetical protein [Pseudomonas putida]MBF8651517.1 hypothetical protein [Pseudomonas putida]MBF8655585.1 hypothetical protein [Pseudomonas putida]